MKIKSIINYIFKWFELGAKGLTSTIVIYIAKINGVPYNIMLGVVLIFIMWMLKTVFEDRLKEE